MVGSVTDRPYRDVRLHKIIERILPEGGTRKYVGHTRTRNEPMDDGILTIYQFHDQKGDIQEKDGYVDIVSTALQDFLRPVFKDYPEPAIAAMPMKFRYPYYSLIHNHSKIEKQAEAFTGSSEDRRHIGHLQKFLTEELQQQLKEFDTLSDFSTELTFKQLWTCFIPGEVVVKRDDNYYEECYEICSVQYFIDDPDRPDMWLFVLSVKQCHYSKGVLGYGPMTVVPIESFSGTKPVHGLTWIPLRARKDWEVFREKKIKDGHEWFRFMTQSSFYHAQYEAVAFTNDSVLFPKNYETRRYRSWLMTDYQEEATEFKPFHVRGDVIIDQEAFAEVNPRYAVFLTREFPTPKGEEKLVLSDKHALITPARVPGFSLSEKVWAYFQVSKLTPVSWQENAYLDLQIDPVNKQLLLDLVRSHQLTSLTLNNDSIPGKGNGLIFLLHGAPGTGKTFTAQAMAHYTKRPLYETTSGELSKKQALEWNLRQALRWSQRWKAIFLLDEADVFLAKRELKGDIKRNEMVTVFLQQLEYSSSIIFLSTNRICDFDPAFLSRIHLPIKFGQLESWQKKRIWEIRTRPYFQLDSSNIDQLVIAGPGLSGRDIRNVVQMAAQLKSFSQKNDFLTLQELVQARQVNLSSSLEESKE